MKKLTRILALTLCCLLAAGLAACGETPAPTPDPDPDPGAAIGGSTQIPNPRVPYENDEFPDFKLAGYPDRDGMKPTGFYLIGGTLAEIDYENATLRCAAKTEETGDIFRASSTMTRRKASFRWDTATTMGLSSSP